MLLETPMISNVNEDPMKKCKPMYSNANEDPIHNSFTVVLSEIIQIGIHIHDVSTFQNGEVVFQKVLQHFHSLLGSEHVTQHVNMRKSSHLVKCEEIIQIIECSHSNCP